MEIKFLSRIALVFGVIGCLCSCREQGIIARGGDTVAIPEKFEIDFDALFDLKQPCVMTPELLESKVAAIAIIPREKLCRPVKFPQETCHYHWFSPKEAPVHNPGYSIFKSGIHPNFVSVVWQEQAMERFYCVYPAEKDQQVPPQLLADMDASLSMAHTFNTTLKQFEWELDNYTVSAEYSTSVGKGDPCFLVNVRNKKVKPKPRSLAQQSSNQALQISLDDFFDWKNPTSMNTAQFQTKIKDFENDSGKRIRVSDRSPHITYYFDPQLVGNSGSFLLMSGRYQASNAYFEWKDGRISNIRISLLPIQGGVPLQLSAEVMYLDKFFGIVHRQLQGGSDVWRWSDYQIRFYKYSNSDSYCIELDRYLQFPLATATPTQVSSAAATSALPTSSSITPATTPAPTTPASNHFKQRLTQINGLLISQLSSGEEAGQVTKMTLTALPNRGAQETSFAFNQEVGESMQRCLNEVSKLSQLRHDIWPSGYSLQIGFEDKYIAKDGPSAAVACGLLVESAITGKTWDPAFAVTGDLNADGNVQPIGGVRAKIRGATNGSCKLVAIPAKNERSIPDILLLDGPAPLIGITIFGIKTFDDAMFLATQDRPQPLKSALADFEAMRVVMMRDPKQIMPLLRSPHAIARLRALLITAPECYSAIYLLLHAQGRTPRVLSLGGSIEAAQGSAQAIVSSIEKDVDTAMSKLKPDEVGSSLNRLRNLRPILDQRVWPYVDGIVDYGDVIRGAILNPVRSGARYVDLLSKANQAASAASSAYKQLMNSSQVREELGL